MSSMPWVTMNSSSSSTRRFGTNPGLKSMWSNPVDMIFLYTFMSGVMHTSNSPNSESMPVISSVCRCARARLKHATALLFDRSVTG